MTNHLMTLRASVFNSFGVRGLIAALAFFICFASVAKAQSALDGFDPNANSDVRSIAVQPDGKILIGGLFTTIGVTTRNRIARLNTDGTLDTAFDPNANSQVRSIAVQSDGRILIGGNFTTIGVTTRNRIARLNADGTVDTTFDPNAGNTVYSIAVQSDGKILIGGLFTTVGGTARLQIARLNADGTLDTAFNPNANSSVNSIAVQSDGKILAGGQFTTIGGQSRNIFARLSNDTAALSTLTVTKTTVTLTRNGSAAQFTRVIFEQSIDNGVTYTTLGTATNSIAPPAVEKPNRAMFAPAAPTASGYTLTGLNLPTGQNILIRARGYYRSGYQNGSETTEDKVQIAFLPSVVTAALVSVTGRVLISDGAGLTNATVTLTMPDGHTVSTRTTSFGAFRFDNLAAGDTLVVTVSAKRYRFAAQVVTANENIADVNFIALP